MGSSGNLRKEAAGHLAARRFQEAIAAYGELLARAPQDVDALHKLGLLKVQTGAPEDGRVLLETALALDPAHAEAWLHHGMALQNLGRTEEAASDYRRAVALRPDFAEALFQLAMVLRHLEQYGEALAALDRCALAAPHEPFVFLQRADLRQAAGDGDGALTDFDHVLQLLKAAAAAGKPAPLKASDVHFHRALALEGMGRDVEALATYERITAAVPGHTDAWSNRGNLLRKEGRLDDAEASFRRALALNANHIPARTNRGVVRALLGRNQEAMADFRHLLEIDPGNRHALGGLLSAAQPLCDWDMVAALKPRLEKAIHEGKAVTAPFHLVLAFSDPGLLRDGTLLFRREWLPPARPRPPLRPADGKIRLAYLSADFHGHATAYLMANLFERHDRSRFEVFGISYGAGDDSAMRARLLQGFDQFVDVQTMSDAQVAALLRELRIDIAIDLKGYTQWGRCDILAHGAAPVQVSYLGYPGTLAAEFCDYVLADPVVLPHALQIFYDEKIVHLPDCYQVNDPERPHPPPSGRAEAGLPETGFVFGCFNNHRKITPKIFEIWMRLLAAVPGSVLWLLDDSANDALRGHARARGIDPARLIFAPKRDLPQHLQRLAAADLMLDTLPYGAHTTASDALWMGVPMVTCLGESFAGRVAASLLTAIDCPELIAESLAGYETLALELARDGEKLAALRARLAANRLTTPLFDAARFCRHIEQAYVTMMETARAGEELKPFDVPVIEG
jgi:predicted O-linked N-acetylglucosamine transferase (SPINDLY family)